MSNKMSALDMVDSCCKVLIKLMCIETNATTAKYKISGLTEKDIQHGDWLITIKKVKEPSHEN